MKNYLSHLELICYSQVSEHSNRDDTLLGKPRTAILYDLDNSGKRPKDSLRILTVGHAFYRVFLHRKACVTRVSPAPPKGTRATATARVTASSSKASAKRKRVSPPTSTNTSPVLKPAARRARVMPTFNHTSPTQSSRRTTRATGY